MARGEIQVAKTINPAKVSDFDSPDQIREYVMDVIQRFRKVQDRGKVIPYEEKALTEETNIVSIAPGSLGGKGRGLAFINSLINNYDFNRVIPDINVRTPKTSVIGTDEFEHFIQQPSVSNQLSVFKNTPVNHVSNANLNIKELFVSAQLSDTTISRLRDVIKNINKPLAVRSSGLFEDSLMQPFAGIFDTYLLPNNHPDEGVRLEHLMNAVKLVFASVFSKKARSYIEAINYDIEEERMAVIIQEVVGNKYELEIRNYELGITSNSPTPNS